MKHYLTQTNEIRAIEDGQEFLIEPEWVELTQDELEARLAPTPEQLAEQVKSEALAYLASTDWYYARKAETGEEVPADVVAKRKEARGVINGNN